MNTPDSLKVITLYVGFMLLLLVMCILLYSFFTITGAVAFSVLFVVGLGYVAFEVRKEENEGKKSG